MKGLLERIQGPFAFAKEFAELLVFHRFLTLSGGIRAERKAGFGHAFCGRCGYSEEGKGRARPLTSTGDE